MQNQSRHAFRELSSATQDMRISEALVRYHSAM